jgi:hypothetical protein
MTEWLSGPGLRLRMQDAGRCGASASERSCRRPSPCFCNIRTRSCGPVVPVAGTTGPFTPIRNKSRLQLSSSGGGLFDGRPTTQTWVWGAFVFPRGKPARLEPECANPKRGANSGETSRVLKSEPWLMLSGAIQASYAELSLSPAMQCTVAHDVQKRAYPSLPQAFPQDVEVELY